MRVLLYEFEGQVGRTARSPAALPAECRSEMVQIRRFHKFPDSDHVYTTKRADIEVAQRALGYADEGTLGWCMRERDACGATLPLFRHYNFLHSVSDGLRNQEGWVYEGVECYLWP